MRALPDNNNSHRSAKMPPSSSTSLGARRYGGVAPGGGARVASPRRSAAALEVLVAGVPTRAASAPLSAHARRVLFRWNVAMALFHAALAATTLAVGNVGLTVDLYKTRLDLVLRNESDANSTAPPWPLVPEYEVSPVGLPFTVLTAVFFLLSCGAHALNASVLRDFYERELGECRTPLRWVEYFFSAPVMFALVAYGLGIRGQLLLLCLVTLVATTMPFGYATEVVARPAGPDAWSAPLAVRLAPWLLGHVPQLVAWLVVILQFYDGADLDDRAPTFVHVILWGEAALFLSFGFAQLGAQLAPPRLFWRAELAFQALSLGSKGLLGLLLLVNVLMLSRFDEIYE